jgi:hypothetical protein
MIRPLNVWQSASVGRRFLLQPPVGDGHEKSQARADMDSRSTHNRAASENRRRRRRIAPAGIVGASALAAAENNLADRALARR